MKAWTLIRLLIVFLIVLAAALLLAREIRNYDLAEIRAGFTALPGSQIALAAFFGLVSYVVLVGYDWLAVRSIGSDLSFARISLASFCGHAVSYNFGALLGGGSVRARLYATWGLSAYNIVRLLAMLGITFWVGAFALAGFAFVIDPLELPADLPLPVSNIRPLGVLLLATVAAYLGLTLLRNRPLSIRGRPIVLPTFRLSVAQLAIASLDLILAAAVLYWLLPPDLDISFARFLNVYLLGVVAVLITHVPGGVGVFELVVLTLIGGEHPEPVVSSLLIFRVLYYLLPLFIAAGLLGAHELRIALHSDSPSRPDESASHEKTGCSAS